MRYRNLFAAILAAMLLLGGCRAVNDGQGSAASGESGTFSQQETEPPAQETPPPSPETAAPESAPIPEPPGSPETFVRVRDYIPDIAADLRYSTENNFTGSVIYDFDEPWLRYGTVEKLASAQKLLRDEGYGICIWDAFRPAAAQDRLWEVCPDGNYVANPANGYSGHTRGDTVDITLVTLEGDAVDMPSDFDCFDSTADRDYSDVSESQAASAALLEDVMTQCGFTGYSMEWWHYSDNTRYSPELQFTPY